MYATADYDGFYHLDGLQAGVYTLRARAYGFSPAELAGLSLGNGQTVDADLTITPAAMSTQPWLAGLVRAARADGKAIHGLLPSWFLGLIDYLKEHNPEPARIGDDDFFRPSIPAAECQEAEQAQRAAENARAHKDSSFEAWESAHKMYNRDVWTSGSVFALQFANMMGSFASLLIPASEATAFADAYPTFSAFSQLYPISVGLYQTFFSFPWDFSSGPAAINTINSLIGTVNDISSAGITLAQLAKALRDVDMVPFGAISAFVNTVPLIQTSFHSWQVLMKAADSVTTAQDGYFKAYDDMMARLRALQAANDACCDPEFDCCPDTECCTDDCCVGSDCGADPPPDGSDDGGGGGIDVVDSHDPNDRGTIGFGLHGFVTPDADLLYTVYFENLATATAPAQQVRVTDMLSPDLDWSSVELLGLGFNNTDPVHVLVTLDAATGTLTTLIESIDPVTGDVPQDPLAGFLLPNDESRRGEGYLAFRAGLKAGLANGRIISNQAHITFDVNPPIDTPVVSNTIDAQVPSSSVQPLPAVSLPIFTVSWTGSDGSGSGIAFYDVYASVDGGAFALWQASVTETQAIWTGEVGYTYGFYSVATDNVGQRQPTPEVAQASTTVQTAQVGVPILLFPPDHTVTTTQAITFSWATGSGAAPTGYNLDVDGTVITTTATSWATTLPLGSHTWTARAYNVAGYSAWAIPVWQVEIGSAEHHIYLPLVLRRDP